jgi:hypothetical protein
MGKSKSSIKKSIASYARLIEEHQEKIDNAIETGKNLQTIPHWQKEIVNFINLMEKELRKLSK